jgi:hypothetical protein
MEDLNSKKYRPSPKSGSILPNRKVKVWGVVLFGLILGLLVFLTISDEDSKEKVSGERFSGTEVIPGELIDGKDSLTGLVLDEGFELVQLNCTRCHSSAIILQSRFTREDWKSKIVWMQQTQGLWDLGISEPLILDYLAKHYAPEAPRGRRAPLKDVEWYELKH